jgi:hypothetical protein
MCTQRRKPLWILTWPALVGAVVLLTMGLQARPASAGESQCPPQTTDAYTIDLHALTGPGAAELTVHVAPVTAACATPEVLKKIELKTFALDGTLASVKNVKDEPSPSGTATLELAELERGQRLEANVLVQTDAAARTYVLRGQTTALLRPDLAVTALQTPAQTLVTRPIDVVAEISELNGDTAAAATVTLSWGFEALSKTTTVSPGGHVSITFPDVQFATPVPTELTVLVSHVQPAETSAANNSGSATVDVTEFELARSRLLVPSLGGYGAQFNQHVFANITPAPPGSFPDLEAKVKALEPQLVRIFYNERRETEFPDRMESFIETVELANETGAAINITYQSADRAKLQPALYMSQFAAILEDLVRNRGYSNVRWVTIQNEPNTTLVTLAQYETLNRAMNAQLISRGLRGQIGIMAGDLVESGQGGGQRLWLQYIAAHMNDIVDAYSEHIYWNYWDTARMEFRLKDLHKLVTEELPPNARKPTYITEFGVRGIQNFPGKPAVQPGYWEDGTPIARTNIAAFQQLWFEVLSAQLGFDGTAKWDAYWGKYDSGTQEHWMIGPADEGWPLFPTYHALRLLLQTTQRGWQVLGVDPWTEDDWTVDTADQPEKEVVAYADPSGELTLVGMDTHARALNGASSDTPAYSIGGLPPDTTFILAIWNGAANGESGIGGTVTANAAGVVRFEVAQHGAFTLTTVPVS